MVMTVAPGAAGQLAVELELDEVEGPAVGVDEIDERELVGEDGGVGLEPVEGVAVPVGLGGAELGIGLARPAGDPEAVPAARVPDRSALGAADDRDDEGGPQPPNHIRPPPRELKVSLSHPPPPRTGSCD